MSERTCVIRPIPSQTRWWEEIRSEYRSATRSIFCSMESLSMVSLHWIRGMRSALMVLALHLHGARTGRVHAGRDAWTWATSQAWPVPRRTAVNRPSRAGTPSRTRRAVTQAIVPSHATSSPGEGERFGQGRLEAGRAVHNAVDPEPPELRGREPSQGGAIGAACGLDQAIEDGGDLIVRLCC